MIDEVLRDARQRNGLSVRALARMADVSPATIDRIEHRRVAPTRSVDRILASIGYELIMTAEPVDEPALTRADRKSLAFHRIIARHLLDDPDRVRAKARSNLRTMQRADAAGRSAPYLDRWAELLDGPEAALIAALFDTSDQARSLRQVTPFSGVMTDAERATVYPRTGARRAT